MCSPWLLGCCNNNIFYYFSWLLCDTFVRRITNKVSAYWFKWYCHCLPKYRQKLAKAFKLAIAAIFDVLGCCTASSITSIDCSFTLLLREFTNECFCILFYLILLLLVKMQAKVAQSLPISHCYYLWCAYIGYCINSIFYNFYWLLYDPFVQRTNN